MWHHIFYGLLLGWGAAIPLGPLNFEMIRRNLRFGTPQGIMLGFGACSADLTYLVLLLLGALAILTYPTVLMVVGALGSLVLLWFGIMALRMPILKEASTTEKNKPLKCLSVHWLQGYAISLLNPYTIIFWASVGAQVAVMAAHSSQLALYYVAAGVILGTVSWVLGCNFVLHFTRHRFSARVMHYLNIAGGIILIGFGLYGLWRVFW